MTLLRSCYKCDEPHPSELAWCDDCRAKADDREAAERRMEACKQYELLCVEAGHGELSEADLAVIRAELLG
jgi:hypothetical protein